MKCVADGGMVVAKLFLEHDRPARRLFGLGKAVQKGQRAGPLLKGGGEIGVLSSLGALGNRDCLAQAGLGLLIASRLREDAPQLLQDRAIIFMVRSEELPCQDEGLTERIFASSYRPWSASTVPSWCNRDAVVVLAKSEWA